MNPFLYKAHPLIYRWADLLANPSAHRFGEIAEPVLIFLALNSLGALGLLWAAYRASGIRLSFHRAYVLALPACLIYVPLMLTVVGDVIAHSFRLEERFILIFSIFVASQMLSGFYAIALRHGRSRQPAGLTTGLIAALCLLLVSIPVCLVLIGLNEALHLP